MKMSFHVVNERQDRLAYICETVGFGEPYVRFKTFQDRRAILTNTGVLLITNNEETMLITAYIARIEEVKVLYSKIGLEIPSTVVKLLRKNRAYYKGQPGAISI